MITIHNKQYKLESLFKNTKGKLALIQFVDSELARLQAQAAPYKIARLTYAKALQAAIPTATTGDTIKFN
jgi:hypothetical protein